MIKLFKNGETDGKEIKFQRFSNGEKRLDVNTSILGVNNTFLFSYLCHDR